MDESPLPASPRYDEAVSGPRGRCGRGAIETDRQSDPERAYLPKNVMSPLICSDCSAVSQITEKRPKRRRHQPGS